MIAIAYTSKEITGKTWRDLIAHIVEAHHNSLRAVLPRLERLADQVAWERRLPLGLLDQLLRKFWALAYSLRTHLPQQEGHLFPMIRHVCELIETTGCTWHLQETLEKLMDEATRADEEAVASVKRAEHCCSRMDRTGNPSLVDKLAKGLHELHEDLEEHVHLETNILFPALRELLQGHQQAEEQFLPESNSVPLLTDFVAATASNCGLDQMIEGMGYCGSSGAGPALKTVLHALRDRLSVAKAIALGTWLPRQVRGLYYENWQHRWDRATQPKKEDFLREIADCLQSEPDRKTEEIVHSVFHALEQHMQAHEVEGARNILPGEIRSLWPAADSMTSMTELIIADQETG